MMAIVFFSVVILFSLTLNIIYKIKAYMSKEKTIWEDGDSVCIKDPNHLQFDNGFMQRIA